MTQNIIYQRKLNKRKIGGNNMPGGRPTKYKPEMCEQIIGYFKEGMSKWEIGLKLNICEDTFYEWQKSNPQFSEAVKKGEWFSQGKWMCDARESMRDKEFNSTLWYMNMKNRFGWTDRKETKIDATISVHEAELEKLK